MIRRESSPQSRVQASFASRRFSTASIACDHHRRSRRRRRRRRHHLVVWPIFHHFSDDSTENRNDFLVRCSRRLALLSRGSDASRGLCDSNARVKHDEESSLVAVEADPAEHSYHKICTELAGARSLLALECLARGALIPVG